MSYFVKMFHPQREGQSIKAHVNKDWFVFCSEKPHLHLTLLISDTSTASIKGGVQMGFTKAFSRMISCGRWFIMPYQ